MDSRPSTATCMSTTPANLYDKYMNPKWGERIPKGQRNGKHGRVEFKLGGGRDSARDHRRHRSRPAAGRRPLRFRRGAGLRLRCRSSRRWTWKGWTWRCCFAPRRCTATKPWKPEYANDLCKAWNSWIADFCKENPHRLKASALITLHDVDLAVDGGAPGGR